MKKKIGVSAKGGRALIAIPAAIGMLFSGLSVVPASAALGTAPVTLTVQYETSAAPEVRWAAIGAAFIKKYPNVTIKYEAITNEAKGGPNLQVLNSDGAPDIALIPLNSNVYTQMVKAKALVSLNAIFAADNTAKRIGPPSAALKQGGNYYAVPSSVAYYNILWTNPLAVARAGATLPKGNQFSSVDELVTFASKCNKAGYAGLAIGGKTNFQASWMFDSMMPSAVTPAAFNNYLNSYKPDVPVTAKWTDVGIVKTFEALGTIAKKGVYQKGYLGMDLDQATAYFTAGKSCMLLGGSWMPGGAFKADTDKGTMKFVPGFAVLPPAVKGGKSTLTPYYGDANAIPIKSKNQEWALELLRYSISDEGQLLGVVKSGVGVAAVTTIAKAEYASSPQLVRDVISFVAKYGAQSGFTSEVPGAYGQQYLNPLIQKLQEGKTSAKEIAAIQQKELDRVRKSGL
jgi:raffinose/stachyose/melibiose transport system substrate-binding protein